MDAYVPAKFERNSLDISAIKDSMWHGFCILVLLSTKHSLMMTVNLVINEHLNRIQRTHHVQINFYLHNLNFFPHQICHLRRCGANFVGQLANKGFQHV